MASLLPTETLLLGYLAARPGEAVSRDELLVHVWGYADGVRSRTVDTTIKTLRKRIEADPARPDHVRTVRGVGYCFEPTTAVVDPSRLPAPTDRFVGREAELQELAAIIDGPDRLWTLLGPGGVGKTRLALRAAQEHGAGRAWFCDLAGARTAGDLLASVASTLDVPLSSRGAEAAVGRALEDLGGALLLLDNAEGLEAPARDLLATWLGIAPSLRLLVTSQRPMAIRGERRVQVGPLPAAAARALLIDRARRVRATFGEAEDDAAITRLSDRLEGMPLAIELAAARAATLSAEALAERLADPLAWLDRGAVGAPDRHRTVRAAIAWTWDLLSDDERSALAQCAVFTSSFTVAAAEAVLELHTLRPVDAVHALQEWSLLAARDHAETGQVRLRLRSTVRAFVLERTPPDTATRARHVAWAVAACSALAETSSGHGAARAWATWRLEGPELAAASLAPAPDLAVRARLLRDRLLEHEGRHEERLDNLDRAVAQAPTPQLRCTALRYRADARLQTGQAGVDEDLEACLIAARQSADAAEEARALASMGLAALQRGRRDEAAPILQQALALHRATGDLAGEADRLSNLGQIHAARGRTDAALESFGDALALHRRRGHQTHMGKVLGHLGSVHLHLGDLDEAARCYGRARQCHEEVGYRTGVLRMQGNLAVVAANRGQAGRARPLLLQVLAESRRTGDLVTEGIALVQLARLAALDGRAGDASEAAHEAERVLGERWPGIAEHAGVALALAHLVAGRPTAARRALQRVHPTLDGAPDVEAVRAARVIEAVLCIEEGAGIDDALNRVAAAFDGAGPSGRQLCLLVRALAAASAQPPTAAIRSDLVRFGEPRSDLAAWLLARLRARPM